MEKRNVIEPGRTPPEEDGGVKQASEEELEDHLTKRASQIVHRCIVGKAVGDPSGLMKAEFN